MFFLLLALHDVRDLYEYGDFRHASLAVSILPHPPAVETLSVWWTANQKKDVKTFKFISTVHLNIFGDQLKNCCARYAKSVLHTAVSKLRINID